MHKIIRFAAAMLVAAATVLLAGQAFAQCEYVVDEKVEARPWWDNQVWYKAVVTGIEERPGVCQVRVRFDPIEGENITQDSMYARLDDIRHAGGELAGPPVVAHCPTGPTSETYAALGDVESQWKQLIAVKVGIGVPNLKSVEVSNVAFGERFVLDPIRGHSIDFPMGAIGSEAQALEATVKFCEEDSYAVTTTVRRDSFICYPDKWGHGICDIPRSFVVSTDKQLKPR